VAVILQLDAGVWMRLLVNFVSLLGMCAAFVKLGLIRVNEVVSIKNMLKSYLPKSG
jgi:hypothetical protein